MNGKQTVKYVAFYQVLATLAAAVGLGIVGVGAWLGFGDAATIVLNDAPQNWADAVSAANPTTFAALAVVGVVVWQVGKTVALVVTMGKVADATGGGAGGVDATAVKQAVMSDVDDRVASVEADVKRHEERLAKASSASSGSSSARSAGASASGGASSRSGGSTGSGEESGRRSRRRGSSVSSADESSSSAGDDASGSGDGSAGESNRRGNRRSSRESATGSRRDRGSGSDGGSSSSTQ